MFQKENRPHYLAPKETSKLRRSQARAVINYSSDRINATSPTIEARAVNVNPSVACRLSADIPPIASPVVASTHKDMSTVFVVLLVKKALIFSHIFSTFCRVVFDTGIYYIEITIH